MRIQRVRQRGERRGRVPDIQQTRLRQGSDAVAVAIQPEGLRRPRDVQQPQIVGHVGVHPLGEVVEQGVEPARGRHLRQDAAVRHVQCGA